MYNKIPIFYKMLHLYTSKSFVGQINHIKISIHERNIRKLYMFIVGCNRCSYCWCLLAVMFDSFATPWTLAYQALLPMGFSRQEYWSGLPFPSPRHESEKWKWSQTLSDTMDCSLPGSSAHGIFQARVLEWGAIAFSEVAHKPWLN